MPRKTIRHKILKMITMISNASGQVIPFGELKFSHRRVDRETHVYKILTPVTRVWQELEISDRHIQSKCLPQHIVELIEYYSKLRPLMERARDLKVYDEDVRPISAQEKQIFGVREGKDNMCFPKSESFYGIKRGVDQQRYLERASVAMGRDWYGA